MLGLDVEWNMDGAGEFGRRLLAGMQKGVDDSLIQMEGTAKGLCPVDIGQLQESITHESTQVSDQEFTGIFGTNAEHGIYVEMGTGPVGRDTAVQGKSPEPAQYKSDGWWIHESQIGRETAEKYHFFHIDTPDGRFYFTNGQPAQPFLYPALTIHEDDFLKNVGQAVREELEGGGA